MIEDICREINISIYTKCDVKYSYLLCNKIIKLQQSNLLLTSYPTVPNLIRYFTDSLKWGKYVLQTKLLVFKTLSNNIPWYSLFT